MNAYTRQASHRTCHYMHGFGKLTVEMYGCSPCRLGNVLKLKPIVYAALCTIVLNQIMTIPVQTE